MASLSDEDLRLKLLEYGEDFPVTESNRKILLNKLTKLKSGDRRSRSRSSGRRSLIGFSSDESESEQRSKGGTRADSGAGAIGTTVSGPTRRSRRSRASLPAASDWKTPASTVFVKPRPQSRRNSISTESKYNGNSNSPRALDTSAPPAVNSSPAGVPGSSRVTRSRASPFTFSTRSKPVPTATTDSNLDSSGSDSDISDSSISNIPENRGVDEFPRSRRSVITQADWSAPAQRRDSVVDSRLDSGVGVSVNPPERSQRYGYPAAASTGSPATVFYNSKFHVNGHHEVIDSAADSSIFNSLFAAEAHNNSQCVSMALVVVAVFFFIVVGVIYLGARHKDIVPYFVTDAETTYVSPICKLNSGQPCIYLDAANHLKDVLRRKAGEADCNGYASPSSRRLSYDAVDHHVTTYLNGDVVDLNEIFYIFEKNPNWGIRLLQQNGSLIPTSDFWRTKWLESAVSDMSLYCRLKLALNNTLYKASLLLAAAVGLFALGYVGNLYWQWRCREREEVFAMVEKILDILQNHHRVSEGDPSAQQYLAIPHVRDMLIPPSERGSKRRLWEKAVRFIQSGESRVRFETQTVSGEDFYVWRWLQSESKSPGEKLGNRSMRIWQGQAFENLDTGVNALPCSPTPCLKVRNMFDPDVEYEDNWPTHIHDAILDKCVDAEIVHLRVDASSNEGCVYIKCKDSETAGRVYRDLHGWWFDGKLVTVKYLRLERYHERFPEAASCSRRIQRPMVPTSTASPTAFVTRRRTTAIVD